MRRSLASLPAVQPPRTRPLADTIRLPQGNRLAKSYHKKRGTIICRRTERVKGRGGQPLTVVDHDEHWYTERFTKEARNYEIIS
jgi:hypothetical protein